MAIEEFPFLVKGNRLNRKGGELTLFIKNAYTSMETNDSEKRSPGCISWIRREDKQVSIPPTAQPVRGHRWYST